MVDSEIFEPVIKVVTGAAHYAYINIPADVLRRTVDGLFPGLAKNAAADAMSGFNHRWAHGHDLITDVMPKFFKSPVQAIKQAGHIVLTDFPTKAGIPIPGLSKSGLGALLTELGIPKGYLSLNIMDTGVGLLAVGEGSHDLMNALAGDLPMNCWTAFDTFGEGGIELVLGVTTQNPILLGAGVENILAGCISTIKTYTTFIDPVEFFGASMTGAILGLGISYALNRQDKNNLGQKVLSGTAKSALMAALGSVSAFFSSAAFVGFTAMKIGELLAKKSNRDSMLSCSCSLPTFIYTLQTYSGDSTFKSLWDASKAEEVMIRAELQADEDNIRRVLQAEEDNINRLLREVDQPLLTSKKFYNLLSSQ